MMHMQSGKRIDFNCIRADDIDIYDIAHNLANICRFNGACPQHYSVAEHSVIVSKLLSDEFKLWGLLHDAHEAYIGDVITPIKEYLGADRLASLKESLDILIAKKINVIRGPRTICQIKRMDHRITNIEGMLFFDDWQDILIDDYRGDDYAKEIQMIECEPPEAAEYAFLEQFRILTGSETQSVVCRGNSRWQRREIVDTC